jgi:D-inositol-3-phosphate glycosyltransferase
MISASQRECDVPAAKHSLPLPGVAVLTGGFDKPYAFGLVTALVSNGISLDVIGSDELDLPELHHAPLIRFLNLYGDRAQGVSIAAKATRVLAFYVRLIRYSLGARPAIFHILWNNKFSFFDRTLLMLYYKLLGKKVVLTAHNVNAGRRDGNDSFLNRITLKTQYRLADHIFVHTAKMKEELAQEFQVRDQVITVIPFGINNSVPSTDLTPGEAKRRLGIAATDRTILFFGNVGPYKGLDVLVAAFQVLAAHNPDYRLVIAGKVRGGCEPYLREIQRAIAAHPSRDRIIQHFQFVPDEDTEVYFKAADVLALPYTEIFQSGVLFLGYRFGLPVVASDVGSVAEDIVEGSTGFLCRPRDPGDLARAISVYFESSLFKKLEGRRGEIAAFASRRHSWDVVADMTGDVYTELYSGKSTRSSQGHGRD